MHVSMLVRRSTALLVALTAASACSDGPSAPRPAERPPFDLSALAPLDARGHGGPGIEARGREGSDTTESVVNITIDPNISHSYAFGQNWIYFPARSICDPTTSGYDTSLWDAPCTPQSRPMKITVRWSNRGGHAYATFSPQLRFVPAEAWNTARWVILSLHDQMPLHDVDDYTILYYAGANIGWINEALTDPTLRAWIDRPTNSVSRRIKHFSGYMLAAGYGAGSGGLIDASY